MCIIASSFNKISLSNWACQSWMLLLWISYYIIYYPQSHNHECIFKSNKCPANFRLTLDNGEIICNYVTIVYRPLLNGIVDNHFHWEFCKFIHIIYPVCIKWSFVFWGIYIFFYPSDPLKRQRKGGDTKYIMINALRLTNVSLFCIT